MFQIINVPDNAADLPEQVGTKLKFWFKNEDLIPCLFKEGRPNTGENWAEKVSCELCNLLNLPHAVYELATWKNKRGVVTPTFVPESGSLIHGNELLAKWVPGYPKRQFFKLRQYTLNAVLGIIKSKTIYVPIGWQCCKGAESAMDIFIGYLMLDAWISNQDRHHENWALILTKDITKHLAPSYDHASSLGRNETDSNRKDRLTTKDMRRSIDQYVKKAASAFYSSSARRLSTIDAFNEAAKKNIEAARFWLERLEEITSKDIIHIFHKLPKEEISEVAIEFAQKMLDLNQERLLSLKKGL